MNFVSKDIINHTSFFLSDNENLVLSVVTKQDWNIDREKHKKNIIYRWVMPIITVNKDNWLVIDKDELSPTADVINSSSVLAFFIQEFSNNLLSPGPWWPYPSYRKLYRKKKYDYTIISDWYIKIPSYYKKFVTSSISLADETKILKNELVCAVYQCRRRGKIRREIIKSLTLKALVG
tara:strand:- start:1287 stop:1820 length:534 start_codon:yes stop_codon:yes gene_type:complete